MVTRKYLWVYSRAGRWDVSALSTKPPYGMNLSSVVRFGSSSYGAARDESSRRNRERLSSAPTLIRASATACAAVLKLHALLDPARRGADDQRLWLALSDPTGFWQRFWPKREPWASAKALSRSMPAVVLLELLTKRRLVVASDWKAESSELGAALNKLARVHCSSKFIDRSELAGLSVSALRRRAQDWLRPHKLMCIQIVSVSDECNWAFVPRAKFTKIKALAKQGGFAVISM
jgi:hypothetical protein